MAVVNSRAEAKAGVETFFDKTTQERVFALTPMWFEDDFIGIGHTLLAGTAVAGYPWIRKLVGAGTAAAGPVSKAINGVMQLSLAGSSEKEEATLYFNDALCFEATQGLVFESRFGAPVLPTGTAVAVVGLFGTWVDNPDANAVSARFKINTAGTVLCEVTNGTNLTSAAASNGLVLGTADNHIGRIELLDVTNVRFFLDGSDVTPVGTTFAITETGTLATLQPYASVYKSAGVGVASLNLDVIKTWGNRQ